MKFIESRAEFKPVTGAAVSDVVRDRAAILGINNSTLEAFLFRFPDNYRCALARVVSSGRTREAPRHSRKNTRNRALVILPASARATPLHAANVPFIPAGLWEFRIPLSRR